MFSIIFAALIGGVALGLANPTLGCLADRYYLSKISTFGIFIISGKFWPFSLSILVPSNYLPSYDTGITLRSDEVGAAADAWPVGLFGLV